MLLYRLIYIGIIILISVSHIQSQNIRFEHLDINDGLSQNNIYALEIDINGNIWAGTLNGLNRYNGHSFEVYKTNNTQEGGITGSRIRALAAVKNGSIWVLTEKGLNNYDPSTNQFIYYNDSTFLPFNTGGVKSIKCDKDGLLWCLSNKQIFGFNPKDSSIISSQELLNINYIDLLPSGLIGAAGSFGLTEIQYTNNNLVLNTIHTKPCISFSADQDHLAIIQSDSFILKSINSSSKGTTIQFADLPYRPSLVQKETLLLNDNKLFVRGGNGLIMYDLKNDKIKCNKYSYEASIPNSFHGFKVTQLIKDKAGNIWIGTAKHGLNIISKQINKFKHINWSHTNKPDIDLQPVRAIYESKNNGLWLSFDRTDIGNIKNNKQRLFTHYINKNGKPQRIRAVRNIFEDNDHNLWIGTLEGVCIYNEKLDQFEHISRYLKNALNSQSYVIKQYDNTHIIISYPCELHIVNWKKKQLKKISFKPDDKYKPSIRDFVIDDHLVWVALGMNGLVKIDTKTGKTVFFSTNSIQLNNNKIYSILKQDENLWIATNNGLSIFDIRTKKVVKTYYEQDGLSNNIVYSLLQDNDSNIWMSTNRGISKFNYTKNEFTNYLKSDFFMDDAFHQKDDGTIFYGGYSRLISFNPNQMDKEIIVLSPMIESFSIHNEKVNPQKFINERIILPEPINKIKHLELTYNENTFSFSFNSMPFDFPNTSKFKSKLLHWNDSWTHHNNNNRKITYTNVKPGKYTFLLAVSNDEQNWTKPKSIDIIIHPPYWQTGWFKFLIAGILVILLGGLYQLRTINIKRRNKLLKQTVDHQTLDLRIKNQKIQEISDKLHEADQAKLQFFTNISHEFRTPLTLILGYMDELIHVSPNKATKAIKSNAKRLLRLVNQLIDYRKLDQGELKLQVSNFELNQLVANITESFQTLAKQKHIHLTFNPCAERLSVWLDIDKMEKVLYNLISNAIKYTASNKCIDISTKVTPDSFYIHIKDQGIGLKPEDINRVFERFYRAKNNPSDGHGIGLAFVKGLVELQHGNIRISSTYGKGSTFSIQLKKGKEHFKPDELAKLPVEIKPISTTKESIVGNYTKTISDKQILLVEDDIELREYLKTILSANYMVTVASDGIEALKLLEGLLPDLIISDINMPNMDGINFCKKVKEKTITSHIPFILLTAKTDSQTQIDSFQLGITDYIEKPFKKELLTARIDAIFNHQDKKEKAAAERKVMMKIDKSKLSKSDIQFWKKVNTLIQKNFHKPYFTAEDLSQKMNLSRSTFYRKFKNISQENAADYIRKIRLQKAAELIKTNQYTLQQISLEVGFQSSSQFRTKFKEQYGVNPSEFR
ncbi:response regulator [Labilibacter sediminis]|nr:response regulator [Labilibacter sediminis]